MVISGSTRGISWKVRFPTADNSLHCKVELQRNRTNAEAESEKELKGTDTVLSALGTLFADAWANCKAENPRAFSDDNETAVFDKMINHVTEILVP